MVVNVIMLWVAGEIASAGTRASQMLPISINFRNNVSNFKVHLRTTCALLMISITTFSLYYRLYFLVDLC